MVKRVTVMVDDDVDKKLRQLQAKAILKKMGNVSYSRILNDNLRKGLK